jgi:phosphatidylethanolamine-binding protein
LKLFSFEDYISAAKLGDPFVGTYFTVQEGQNTVSVAQTSSVDSTTLPQYTPTSSSAPQQTTSASSAMTSVHLGAGSLLFSLLAVVVAVL